MKQRRIAQAIIDARRPFRAAEGLVRRADMKVDEGGCGVTGFACSIPVSGKHIFAPSVQMHNRGNGKGGGLAAVGLTPAKLGVDQETLANDFLFQGALLDESLLPEMELQFLR